MKNCQWELRQTIIVSSVKSLWGKKQRGGWWRSYRIVNWPVLTWEIRNREFRFRVFVMFPFHRPTRHGRFRSRFFPPRVSHSRLKWNFTPPVWYRPFSSYPRQKKKFCGLRSDALRRHKSRISESGGQSPPSSTKFPDPHFSRKALALFPAEFFFDDPHGEKKDRVNYVCGINNRDGEKKIGWWRTKVHAVQAKESSLWKRYEQ